MLKINLKLNHLYLNNLNSYFNSGVRKELPKYLIYKRNSFGKQSFKDYYWEEFVAFSTKKQNGYGMLVCHKHDFGTVRKDSYGKTLLIDYLMAFPQNKGFGTALINFAKNYSKHEGCNGHILLKADSSFTPNRTPHIFYRKNGFGTADSKIDQILDKLIKQHKTSNYKNFSSILMYYPPMHHNDLSVKEKIIRFFKSITFF